MIPVTHHRGLRSPARSHALAHPLLRWALASFLIPLLALGTLALARFHSHHHDKHGRHCAAPIALLHHIDHHHHDLPAPAHPSPDHPHDGSAPHEHKGRAYPGGVPVGILVKRDLSPAPTDDSGTLAGVPFPGVDLPLVLPPSSAPPVPLLSPPRQRFADSPRDLLAERATSRLVRTSLALLI